MNGTTPLIEGTTEEPKTPLSERLPIGLLYMFMMTSGLAGYGIVILGFIRDRKEYAKIPFYKLIYNLAIGDVGMLLIQIVLLPVVFTGEPVYSYNHLPLGFLNGLFFWVVFYTSLLIALNRFCVFVLPPNHILTEFFEKHLNKICMLPWLFGFFLKGVSSYFGVIIAFSHRKFYWSWRYLWALTPVGGKFLQLVFYHELVVPMAMFCMYIVIFLVLRFGKYRVRMQSSEVARNRGQQEMRLLLQSVIICTILETEILTFTLPISGLIVNVFSILNSSINPFIFLLFNSTVRASVKKVLGIANKVDTVVVTVTQPKE